MEKNNPLKFHEQLSTFGQGFKNRKILENFCRGWSIVEKFIFFQKNYLFEKVIFRIKGNDRMQNL